jgi:glutamate-5-semialdehyde dehydrogenase
VQTILKNKVLIRLSEIISSHENEILAANRQDLNAFPDMDASTKDRLKVDEKKIVGMIQSLRDVAELPDPKVKYFTDIPVPTDFTSKIGVFPSEQFSSFTNHVPM